MTEFPAVNPQQDTNTGRVLHPKKVTAWRNDFTVDYEVICQNRGGGKRSDIHELTKNSLMRMAFVAHNTSIEFDIMVTLTYPKNFPSNGEKVKRNLKWFLTWMRRKADVISYFWFMEFQRRGAPHFHIFTSGGDLMRMKKQVSQKWYDIVESGDYKHLQAGTRVERLRHPEAAGRYAAKYASKPHQKRIPDGYTNVGRWWGHSRDVKPEPLQEKEIETWDDLIFLTEGWSRQDVIENKKAIKTLFNATTEVIKKAEQ